MVCSSEKPQKAASHKPRGSQKGTIGLSLDAMAFISVLVSASCVLELAVDCWAAGAKAAAEATIERAITDFMVSSVGYIYWKGIGDWARVDHNGNRWCRRREEVCSEAGSCGPRYELSRHAFSFSRNSDSIVSACWSTVFSPSRTKNYALKLRWILVIESFPCWKYLWPSIIHELEKRYIFRALIEHMTRSNKFLFCENRVDKNFSFILARRLLHKGGRHPRRNVKVDITKTEKYRETLQARPKFSNCDTPANSWLYCNESLVRVENSNTKQEMRFTAKHLFVTSLGARDITGRAFWIFGSPITSRNDDDRHLRHANKRISSKNYLRASSFSVLRFDWLIVWLFQQPD